MDSIHDTLERYGLSPSEVSLYLAALAAGEAYMSTLARHAGLKRSNAYNVFKMLEAKGLMGSFRGANGARFIATKPEALLRQMEKRAHDLRHALPQLNALAAKSGERPKVSYYEGKEGYFLAMEQSLAVPGTVTRHIGSLLDINQIIDESYIKSEYIPRRIAQGVSVRALYYEDDPLHTTVIESHEKESREVRFLPAAYRTPVSKFIYGNTVALFTSVDELVTVLIESSEVARHEERMFDLLWDLVGPTPLQRRGRRAPR